MIPGLNHNIRYRERTFHVQSEDSGLIRRMLTTHIFIDGSVIAHERTSYEGALAPNLDDLSRNSIVRKLMQDQHKGLLKRLIKGEFDDILVKLGVLSKMSVPPQRSSAVPAAAPSDSPKSLPPIARSHPPTAAPRSPSLPPLASARPPSAPPVRPPSAPPVRSPSKPPASPLATTLEGGQSPLLAPRASTPPRRFTEPPIPTESRRPSPPAAPPPPMPRGAPMVPLPSVPPSIAPPKNPSFDAVPALPAATAAAVFQAPPTSGTSLIPPKRPATRDIQSPLRPNPTGEQLRWGRTLVDEPAVLPPVPTGMAPSKGYVRALDEPTMLIEQDGTRAKARGYGHDTILDASPSFDLHERRTEPPGPRVGPPAPRPPPAAPSTRMGPPVPSAPPQSHRDRSGIPVSLSPHATPLMEDPSIETALMNMSPIAASDSSPDFPSQRRRLTEDLEQLPTDPGRRMAPPAKPQPPKPPEHRGMFSTPAPSSPPLAGAAWLDAAAELAAAPRSGAGRPAPGPRPWAAEIPSGSEGLQPGKRARPPAPTPRWSLAAPHDSHTEIPAWPPPDSTLEQYVHEGPSVSPDPIDEIYADTHDPPTREARQAASPTPSPRNSLSPGNHAASAGPIRIEERSLDDIILGYLSTKTKR